MAVPNYWFSMYVYYGRIRNVGCGLADKHLSINREQNDSLFFIILARPIIIGLDSRLTLVNPVTLRTTDSAAWPYNSEVGVFQKNQRLNTIIHMHAMLYLAVFFQMISWTGKN